MDFFEVVRDHLNSLSNNEQDLLDYVVKHMNEIQGMTIREAATATFTSTATFLRFVKKIGFSGYSEFVTVIKYTALNQVQERKPNFSEEQIDYREAYLANIYESVRVIPIEKLNRITTKLAEHPDIYLFAKGISKHAAEYVNYIYSMAGFNVNFPSDFDYRGLAVKQVRSESLVFILTYDGNDPEWLQMLNDFECQKVQPMIVSITESNNNTLQSLSALNFYIFTDALNLNAHNVSSRISSVAIMELLLYQYIENFGNRDFHFKEQV
ncbi:MurR/RpiR family transcriptional regulator [Weissella muntiaci]|uniref:MurR/RpiR family transcriptional regulator n=1 Tax=Weissella muntiaci TaxID=2508881 RepID=A0A6C2C7W0_9LACO|nr:MurR/RpiR family transcriptional regulator [Weissella muntiaci]TYC49686.1 MurR/RpiR family transcriptional regulator [Weissella muntiaci]